MLFAVGRLVGYIRDSISGVYAINRMIYCGMIALELLFGCYLKEKCIVSVCEMGYNYIDYCEFDM